MGIFVVRADYALSTLAGLGGFCLERTCAFMTGSSTRGGRGGLFMELICGDGQ